MADTYCFVCGKPVEPRDRAEMTVPHDGGRWVFTLHEACSGVFEDRVPARFNEMVLRALGRPKPLP